MKKKVLMGLLGHAEMAATQRYVSDRYRRVAAAPCLEMKRVPAMCDARPLSLPAPPPHAQIEKKKTRTDAILWFYNTL